MTDEEKLPLWATRLRTERERRGWNKHEMARQLHKAASTQYPPITSLVRQILGWEKGEHFPRDWTNAYAVAYEIPENELFGRHDSVIETGSDINEEEMERRKLLQALTTLGVASSPLDALQTIREGVGRALGHDEASGVDEWEETVAEYGYSYLLLSPRLLLPDLAADLVTVRGIMSRCKGSSRLIPSWYRVTSGLSLLMAKTLSNCEQPRLARQWWTTAQQAAGLSGDNDLTLWVTAERVGHGLYEHRPVPLMIRQANEVAERASGTPCRGLTAIHAVRAQLLALDGLPDAATAELRHCAETFEQLPSSVADNVRSIDGWAEDRLRYTQAWVHAHLGQRDKLDQVVTRTHALLPPDQSRVHAQTDLLHAFGHVRAGDTAEGVRHAQTAYERIPIEQKTTLIVSLAEQVLDAVPVQNRSNPVVVAYRELLASQTTPARVARSTHTTT